MKIMQATELRQIEKPTRIVIDGNTEEFWPLYINDIDISPHHLINKEGLIYSLKSNRILSSHKKRGRPYRRISLYFSMMTNTSKTRKFYVHRLVAFSFLIRNYPDWEVDHIRDNLDASGCKNDELDNLQWVNPYNHWVKIHVSSWVYAFNEDKSLIDWYRLITDNPQEQSKANHGFYVFVYTLSQTEDKGLAIVLFAHEHGLLKHLQTTLNAYGLGKADFDLPAAKKNKELAEFMT